MSEVAVMPATAMSMQIAEFTEACSSCQVSKPCIMTTSPYTPIYYTQIMLITGTHVCFTGTPTDDCDNVVC